MDLSRLAEQLADLSQELMSRNEEQPTVQTVVERAVEIIPGAEFASVTLRVDAGTVETAAASNELARACDHLQYGLAEGPCLDSVRHEEIYVCRDTAADPRWPRWGAAVAEKGVGSVLSVQLATDLEVLGALNVYAGEPDAFDTDAVDLGMLVAAQAATALSSARVVTGLQSSLHGRHLIGVAQGMLMIDHGLSLEQAFEVMRRFAEESQLTLREVAGRIIEQRRTSADTLPRPRSPQAVDPAPPGAAAPGAAQDGLPLDAVPVRPSDDPLPEG